MQIRAVRSRVVCVPLRKPVVARIGTYPRMWFVLVDLDTDEGVSGLSYVWAFTEHGARAIQRVLDELAEVAVGEDPTFNTRLWRRMWARITQWGHKGLTVIAMAAIDTAAWDIAGKSADRPLAQLLGAYAERVPTYASEGLWLTDDLAALGREAEELVAAGFKAVKMRLGRLRMQDDLAAVRTVREAIGPDVVLMADANQGWDADYTIRIGRRLEEYDLFWLEEPVPHDDLVGHARVAAALDTPLASGENVYTQFGFREAIEANAFDIVMPDLERVGGVTGWMRTAALAEAWHKPLCSHLFPEMSVHTLAASPTACYLEHMPWGLGLFQEPLEMADGQVAVPSRPGLGLTWDEGAIKPLLVE